MLIETQNFQQPLSDMDLQFFNENGYIGPFSISDYSRFLNLKKTVDNLDGFPGKFLNSLANKFPRSTRDPIQSRMAHILSKESFDLVTESTVVDKVSSILGPDLLLWMASVVGREPGSQKSWHIDLVNAVVDGVHASVAVTDMNLSNGCLRLIPGTHKYKIDPHKVKDSEEYDFRSPESMLCLADRLHPENAPHKLVPMELKAGQFFLMKGFLWHGVGINQSSEKRLSIIGRYMQPSIAGIDLHNDSKYKQLPCILVRGKDNYKLNKLYSPPNHFSRFRPIQ